MQKVGKPFIVHVIKHSEACMHTHTAIGEYQAVGHDDMWGQYFVLPGVEGSKLL